MQHESIQIRSAVKMFINFILEHHEQLEQEMNKHQPKGAEQRTKEPADRLPKEKPTSNNSAKRG